MKIITFRKEFKELILNGKKIETRRIKKCVKVGDILLAKVGRLDKVFAELEVIGFKRERLNKITMVSIFNEGCTSKDLKNSSATDWFIKIWNLINNKDKYRYEDNPIVSVIKFKLIKIR